MKSPQNVILSFLTCILSSVVLTSCGPSASSLVGEWQSSKPESVHLTITKGASYNSKFAGDGGSGNPYRRGFSFMRDGSTQNYLWLIKNGNSGTILYIAGANEWAQSTDSAPLSGVPYKVVELTSDKLVLQWDNVRQTALGTYEFHRVK